MPPKQAVPEGQENNAEVSKRKIPRLGDFSFGIRDYWNLSEHEMLE
jgi:hypothetical protein